MRPCYHALPENNKPKFTIGFKVKEGGSKLRKVFRKKEKSFTQMQGL